MELRPAIKASLALIVSVAITGMVAFAIYEHMDRRLPPVSPPECLLATSDPDLAKIITLTVDGLSDDLADWQSDRILQRFIFYALTGGGALLSLLAAILIAARERPGPKSELPNILRYMLIAVPAVSAAFSTAAIQFHIADVLDRRIDGIAQIEDLQRQLLQSQCEPSKIDAIHETFVRLERSQAALPRP
jgi:hypothetical protein